MVWWNRSVQRVLATGIMLALLMTALVGFPIVAGAASVGVFDPHPTTPAFGPSDGWTRSVVLGDLDGDGDLDAVVVSLFVAPNSVWLNDGVGNFSAHPTTPTFGSMLASDVKLADLNGDTFLDAFVVASGRNQVFLNDGAGNFTQVTNAVPLVLGVGSAVALGDVNGDTHIDAVVTYLGESDTRVFLNNGSGVFTSGSSIAVENSADVVLGDVNGDGDLDAIIAGFAGGAQSVWLGNGDGTFIAGGMFGAGNSRALALGDIDGDNDLDVIVANDDDEAQTVWLNDGSGAFSAHPAVPTFGSGFSWDIVLVDIDGDNDLDIVVANEDEQAQTVWLNDGTGAFTPHPTVPEFGAGVSVALAAGDLDDDQDPDLVVANFAGQHTVWLNMDNTAPTADAGGPYSVIEGGSVELDGTGSSDPDTGDSLTFEWDLDGDGNFGETGVDAANGDETGATPTFQTGALTGPLAWTVTLRVTDAWGATDEASATINIVSYGQACLYGGSLSRVGLIGAGSDATVTCARGEPIVIELGDDIFACLFAGSLSQVGYSEPSNCGRGTAIGFAAGSDLYACLFAGSLSQVGYNEPSNCGRGASVGFMGGPPSDPN